MRSSSAVVQRIVALRAMAGFGSAEGPGLFGGQIFVGSGDHGPDGFEGARKFHFVEALEDFADRGLGFLGQGVVLRLALGGLRNFAGKILFDQGGGAAGEIAEAVGEVAVVARDE